MDIDLYLYLPTPVAKSRVVRDVGLDDEPGPLAEGVDRAVGLLAIAAIFLENC